MRDKYRDTENEYNITLRKLEERGFYEFYFNISNF